MTRKSNKQVTSSDAGEPPVPAGDDDMGFTVLGDIDAQEPTDHEPQAGGDDQPQGDGAPPAEGAVDGDGGPAAETGPGEHAGEPPVADRGTEPAQLDTVVSDEKASIDAGDGSAGISDAPAALVSEKLPDAAVAAGVPSGAGDEPDPLDGAGGAAEAAASVSLVGADDAQPAAVPPNVGNRYAIAFPPVDGETDLRDGMFSAACTVEYFAARLEYHFGAEMPATSVFSGDIVFELADLVRKIGARATPDVMAQQLVIRGLRDTATLTTPQRMALEVFGLVARALQQHEDVLTAAMLRSLEPAPEPPPVPIEETTLELVDDVMGGV